MNRTDPDTVVIVAGVVISLVALVELYQLMTSSDAE